MTSGSPGYCRERGPSGAAPAYARAMTQPSAAPGTPPKKQGMSPIAIVLIILGSLFLLGVGTCAAGAFWLKGKAEALVDGGGLVLVSPPEVKSALAGPKKAYVGDWHGEDSHLAIDADGNVKFEKHGAGGSNQTYTAPVAAFVGNDIELKIMINVIIKVTRPPHQVGDHWEMTADGIAFTRK